MNQPRRLWNHPNAIAYSTVSLAGGATDSSFLAGGAYCPSAGWLVEYAVDFRNSDQLIVTLEAGVAGKRDGRVVVAEDFEFGTSGMFCVLYPYIALSFRAGSATVDFSINMVPLETDDAAIGSLPYILQGSSIETIAAAATNTVPIPIGATGYQVLPADEPLGVIMSAGGMTRAQYAIESSAVASVTAGAQGSAWRPTVPAIGGATEIQVTNTGGSQIDTAVLFQYDLRHGTRS